MSINKNFGFLIRNRIYYPLIVFAGLILSAAFLRDKKDIFERFDVDTWALPISITLLTLLIVIYIENTRKQRIELLKTEEQFRLLFEASPDGIFILNDRVIMLANGACAKLFGFESVERIIGGSIAGLLNIGSLKKLDEMLDEIKVSGSPVLKMEDQIFRLDGTKTDVEITVATIKTYFYEGVEVIFRDITEQKLTAEKIQHLAFYDFLTNLPNRRMLLERLREAQLRSEESGFLGAIFFLDLDHFKSINDSLSHNTGDLILKEVAKRLQNCVRMGDTVARIGGDEFVVVLEELDGNKEQIDIEIKQVIKRIQSELSKPYTIMQHEYYITPSIGVTYFNGLHESIDDLLKQADLAMYQAKAMGRDAFHFFSPEMQSNVNYRASLEGDFRDSLKDNHFILHFQPQFDDHGKVVGVEGLVRWQHPVLGLLMPSEFISIAEDTGLIFQLGKNILELACIELERWADILELDKLTLAVNVSAREFRNPAFALDLLDLLDQYQINPKLLKLELTESVLLGNVDDAIKKMGLLKDCGVRFGLDDFGTGYSSLYYLKHLPLDHLKIDQSFVQDILTDSNDAAIAQTIVGLGHSLGFDVIAEGVETQEQRDFLRGIGCKFFQGYFYCRPLSHDDFVSFVVQREVLRLYDSLEN